MRMSAVTRGRRFLCVAGLILQFLILFKCCAITVTVTTPIRGFKNVSATDELMTLRAVGRSVTQCLAATEQWRCFEAQLLRFVDAVAQDNSTWQLGDYIFVEKLASNESDEHAEEQPTFSKNQAVRQRSLRVEDVTEHEGSGIASSLLQLAKTRSIRLQLPTSAGTLSKIGVGISDAIDGLALQNIVPTETEAAQADEGTHRIFNGLVDDKVENFTTKITVSDSDDTILLQNDKDKLEIDKDKNKNKKKKKKDKDKKNKKKHKKDKCKDKDKKRKEKDKYKDKNKNKSKRKKDKYKDKDRDKYKDKDKDKDWNKNKKRKDKDNHKKKLVIKEGLLHNYNSLKGRKKKGKDKNMAMMGGMAMMAMVAQMFLGKVILIAGAAFVMAKIALLVSVLGSLKKGSTGSSVNTERIVVTGHGHSGGGGHGGYGNEDGWQRRMPHTYAGPEIISEEPQPVEAYHHSPTPPPPLKLSASHQQHGYYVNEINGAVNEDTDDAFRRRQAQTGFL